MKYIALLAVIGAGLMALPGTAAAQAPNCPNNVDVQNPPQYLRVCVNVNGAGGEAFVCKDLSCAYVNAWSTNPITPGYAGFNNGGISETGTKDTNCDGIDSGSGTNSGGCFWIKPAPAAVNNALQNAVTAMFICGNTSGEDPRNSNRDGCAIP